MAPETRAGAGSAGADALQQAAKLDFWAIRQQENAAIMAWAECVHPGGTVFPRSATLLKWLSFNALGTYLFTRFQGVLVGEDEIGNRYYRQAPKKGASTDWRAERRWVVYPPGIEPEPTLVPPGWSGWLHKRFAEPPTVAPLLVKAWEKPNEPNLTGTEFAYVPPGSERGQGKRDKATGDYEAWTP